MGERHGTGGVRRRTYGQAGALVAIALGGALGAPARYEIAQAVPASPGSFPWATFLTNLSGAFVLGVFLGVLVTRTPAQRMLRAFFAVGVLGSYTTFSTLAVETATLVKDGHAALGVAYTVTSVGAGLLAAFLGMLSGRAFRAEH